MPRSLLAIVLLLLIAPLNLHAQYVSPFQVIPQVADGTVPDGSAYGSLIFINKQNTAATNCALTSFGFPSSRLSETSINFGGSGESYTVATTVSGPLVVGYVTVSCNGPVSVNTLYVLSRNGTVESMGTVFSQGPFSSVAIAGVMSPPLGRIGIAIANNSAVPANYTINVNIGGNLTGKNLTIPAQTATSQFLDEILPSLPSGLSLPVEYITSTVPISATALYFNGSVFTTIPLTIFF